MKLLLTLLFSTNVFAAELECSIQSSFTEIFKQKVQIEKGTLVKVFEHDGFVFNLRSLSETEFEIEVFDPNVPARSYASGVIKEAGDSLRWSLWTRYVSLDMICR